METVSQSINIRESADFRRAYLAWLLFFLFMIGVVGGIMAYVLASPLCLIGRFYRPARLAGEKVFQLGVYILIVLEPWLDAGIQVETLPGALSVSNHRSHLDTFILLSRVSGIRVLAKHTLFYIPFLGLMMWMFRQIPIRRGSVKSYWSAMDLIRKGLREGDKIHVFPEMTRCPLGMKGTQHFQLAPFHIAFQEKVKVLPIVFVGTDRAWPKGKLGISFRTPIVVQSLPPIDSNQFVSAEALAEETKKQIDNYLASQSS